MKHIPIRRIAMVSGIALTCLILLIGIFIAALPSIVSTSRVRAVIEKQVSAAIQTDVTIETLAWSWTEGFLLQNLVIADYSGFSKDPLLTLNRLSFRPYLADLLKRCLHARLDLSGLYVNGVRKANGTLNLAQLLSAASGDAAPDTPPETFGGQPPFRLQSTVPLPMDAAFSVFLEDMHLSYKDLETGQTAAATGMSITLDMPSLVEKPVTFVFSTDLALNEKRLPGQRLSLTLSHPRFEDRQMDFNQVAVDLAGDFSGISITASGNPVSSGIKGRVLFHLPEMLSLARPFLPPDLAGMAVAGTLLCRYDIHMLPGLEKLAFDTSLSVQDTVISGGPVAGGLLGPVFLTMVHKGSVNIKEGALFLEKGAFDMPSGIRSAYTARATGLYGSDPVLDFSAGRTEVDVKALYDFCRPLLPEELRQHPPAVFETLGLEIETIGFSGNPAKSAFVLLEGLRLFTPGLRILPETALADVTDVSLAVPRLTCTLEDHFPAALDLALKISVSGIKLGGELPMRAAGIHLQDLHLAGTNLKASATSPLGITGDMVLKDRFSIDAMAIPNTAELKALVQEGEFHYKLQETPVVGIAIDRLNTAIGRLTMNLPEPETVITTAGLSVTVPSITVSAMAPFAMDIRDARIKATLADAMTFAVSADIKDTGNTLVDVRGNMGLDLEGLSGLISPVLLGGVTVEGRTGLSLGVTGRRFTSEELERVKADPYAMKENLPFIHTAYAALDMKDVSFETTMGEDMPVRVAGITTLSPLSYAYDGQTGIGRLSGKLAAGHVEALPENIIKDPLAFVLKLNGIHDGLEKVVLSQALTLSPFDIKEAFDLELAHVDALLASGLNAPMADVLTRLGAAVNLSVTPAGQMDFAAVKAVSSLSGDLSLQSTVHLAPGEAIRFQMGLNCRNFNAAAPDLFALENLNADVRLDKMWSIRTAQTPETKDLSRPLSIEVLDAAPDRAGLNPAGENVVADFLGSVKNRLKPARSVSISRVQVEGLPFPAAVRDMALDLELNNGLPRLPYIHMDLFGGTMLMSLALEKAGADFQVGLDMAFSGIDTRKLFPETGKNRENPDTEISGQMAVRLPMTTSMDTLLNRLTLDVHFSHIGKSALERMLYALDPTESNEEIVSQRKLLRKGTPKWIRVTVSDGALSYGGQVDILGVAQSLPAAQPVNISEPQFLNRFEGDLAGLQPVMAWLNRLSSSVIDVTHPENIQFME